MGLFGRLLGRDKPRWQENWAVFPGDADDLFAMYCVDLGAVAAAPIDGLPIRLDVEVRFAAREDGMPADGHLTVVQRFEEVVSAEARDRRGAYVGRMIVDGLCRYTAYLPSVPVGPLALPRDDFAPVVTTTADPGWAYHASVLDRGGAARDVQPAPGGRAPRHSTARERSAGCGPAVRGRQPNRRRRPLAAGR